VVAGVLLATMLISLLAGPKKQGTPLQP
jgi:hypothetical protein